MNILQSKIYKTILLVCVISTVGVFGYMFLSEASFVDALYMTVITITTVGFGEIRLFTPQEKIFTIFLILTSISVFGYTISSFTEYIISGQFVKQFKLKKVKKTIEKLEGHTIICGYGRNGKQSAKKLKNYLKEFVIIEKDENVVEKIDAQKILCVEGDATTDEILLRAGVEKAANLITALPSDADNLFVVLSTKQFNKKCKIISRASDESSYSKLKIAGADNVIMPDKIGGAHMASLVVTPDVIEFVDKLTIEGETNANLEEIAINDLPEKYINKTILDLDLRNKTGCTVIGFKTSDNKYIINPDSTIKLLSNSNLIVLGDQHQISKLRTLF